MRSARLPALVAVLVLLAWPAWAQAHNPFGVGISEGGGAAGGLTGWIMAQQGAFERSIARAVRSSATDPLAAWLLIGLSFLYGVLHAAGPGHGKAVLASYLVANRRALRRGLVLSFLAALLQAAVAIGLVLALSFVVRATATGMRDAASLIERLSYAGVALFGAWLVWRKARLFRAAWSQRRLESRFGFTASAPAFALAGTAARFEPSRWTPGTACADPLCRPVSRPGMLSCETSSEHGPGCVHGPDPATLGGELAWRDAAATVVAAGARPCSGAILVMVFAVAQGALLAGIGSTLAMALGTALTTAALASTAVLAKDVALRLTGSGEGRGLIVARGVELAAALLVLAVGLSLLAGLGPLQGLA